MPLHHALPHFHRHYHHHQYVDTCMYTHTRTRAHTWLLVLWSSSLLSFSNDTGSAASQISPAAAFPLRKETGRCTAQLVRHPSLPPDAHPV